MEGLLDEVMLSKCKLRLQEIEIECEIFETPQEKIENIGEICDDHTLSITNELSFHENWSPSDFEEGSNLPLPHLKKVNPFSVNHLSMEQLRHYIQSPETNSLRLCLLLAHTMSILPFVLVEEIIDYFWEHALQLSDVRFCMQLASLLLRS